MEMKQELKTIEFNKTGNFWIDNGIVMLYKILLEYYENVELKPDKLIIKSENSIDEIIEVLNKAKKIITENYLTKTENFGWYYSEEETFKTYSRTDFKMYIKPFFKGVIGIAKGKVYFPKDKKKAKEKDLVLNEEKFQEFNKFKEDFKKLDDVGYLHNPPIYDIGTDFDESFIIETDKCVCDFSGEKIKLKGQQKTSGLDYPFLMSKGKGDNFSSMLKLKPVISEKYAFASLFSRKALYFSKNEDITNYFLLFDNALNKLSDFYTITSEISQIDDDKWNNFKLIIKGIKHEHEGLLNFILSLYEEIKAKLLRDKRKEIYNKAIFTFTDDGNIFRDVKEYNSLEKLFNILDEFTKNEEYSTFINFITRFQEIIKGKTTKYNTIWRNRLAECILYFKSISKITEDFISNVLLKQERADSVYHIDKILETYNNKITKIMKPEIVSICKSLGNRIGAYCGKQQDKGILYSIRNTRNRMDFLKVLADTQFKTEISYSEDFFNALPEDKSWEEYKSLVSIFAMNSFLYNSKKL